MRRPVSSAEKFICCFLGSLSYNKRDLKYNLKIMTTLIINKAPKELSFEKNNIDFDVFLVKLFDYMQDLEDIQRVKSEMSKNPESFDYDVIRKDYV